MLNLQAIIARYGGEISGNSAVIPSVGHSKNDRGTSIKVDPNAPDGCLVHCFNGSVEDALAVKEMLRRDGFLVPYQKGAAKAPLPDVSQLIAKHAPLDVSVDSFVPANVWEYKDANGVVLYRKVRINKPDGSKSFLFESPDGKGGWTRGIGGRRHVPYRLPELLGSEGLLFAAEGERCADFLVHWGYNATSSKDLDKADLSVLSGKTVVVLPDNDEAGQKCAQESSRAIHDAGGKPVTVVLPDLPDKGDIIDWAASGTSHEFLKIISDALERSASSSFKRHKSSFHFTPLWQLAISPPEFLVADLIETESLGLVFGDPGCGKSFLAVDLAMSVATGLPFHGKEVMQGSVFFIAGEGHNGLTRRLAAWVKQKELPTMREIPFFKSNRAAQLLDASSATEVKNAVSMLAKDHGDPALIIIDTLARNFGGGDENSTKDMTEFVAAVDDIRANFAKCTIIIVHHTGHMEKQRARGAMALKGALDCEYRLEKRGDVIEMTNTKMKDAEPPRSMRFELATVVFDDGSSSAVLESSEMEMRSSSSEMTKSQRLTLNTYVDAAKLNGELGEDGRIRLHIDHWRPEFYASHTGDKIEAKRKAFSRGREKLVEMNILEVRNDVYTLLDDVSAILLQDIRRASDSSSSDEMDDTDWREQDVVSL